VKKIFVNRELKICTDFGLDVSSRQWIVVRILEDSVYTAAQI